MSGEFIDEVKLYVGFGPTDEACLAALGPLVEPEIPRISDVFYKRILDHAGSRASLVAGERSVGFLKVTLQHWLKQLFEGPYDHTYYDRRATIGRTHVRIRLPQHYMFAAMNVLRRELSAVVDAAFPEAAKRLAHQDALQRLLDIELAIMLHTFRQDMLSEEEQSRRLDTFRSSVSALGEQLRDPLGVIETSTFLLKRQGSSPDDTARHLERIEQQVHSVHQLISALLEVTRGAVPSGSREAGGA